jgi:hypothetical protein
MRFLAGVFVREKIMAVLRLWLCVLVLLTAAGCIDFLNESTACGDQPTDIAQLGRFELPPDYTNLATHCTRWMDHSTTGVSFNMPPEHLAQFQASTQIEQWQSTTNTTQIERFDMLDVRRFQAMDSYLYGETSEQLLGSGTQQVVIDTSDPLRYTVYLTYFVSY